jgi:hypothetical protein
LFLGARICKSALLLFRLGSLVLLVLPCAVNAAAPANALKSPFLLRWTSNAVAPGRWTLEVIAASDSAFAELRRAEWNAARWQKLLVVHVEEGDAIGTVGMPAVLGTYRVGTTNLQFEPQFPLEPGIKYAAAFFPSQLPGNKAGAGGVVSSVFEIPRESTMPSTVVAQIYPSAPVLPENLLKFYVHFSAPMSRGHIYDHIHLRNEAGKNVELPFLEIDEELWNPELTRLTLFIDPGRIKRGVKPLEEIGPSLEEGHRYTLVIDAAWKDGRGIALKEPFQKSFRVGAADREPVQLSNWKVQPPKAATREPLVVQFNEAMDHALASRVIHVVDFSTRSLPGKIGLSDHEQRWSFVPAEPWSRGAHALLVQNTIEDLAGNNVGKSFEVDLFDGVQRRFTNTTVKLSFEVR